jgi:hypothetical protein
MGWPLCWHGCCDFIAIVNLGLTFDAINHRLTQRCVKIGEGLNKGLGSLQSEFKC